MSNYTDYLMEESLQYMRDYTENMEVLLLVAITLFLLLWYGEKLECEQLLKEVRQRNAGLMRGRAKPAKFQSRKASALAKASSSSRLSPTRAKALKKRKRRK